MKTRSINMATVICGAISLILLKSLFAGNRMPGALHQSNDIPVNSSGPARSQNSPGTQNDAIHGSLEITKPPAGAQTMWPFYKPTQYLYIEEFKIHVFGTATVSEWMMQESYLLISNMVAALKRPEDRRKFAGHHAFLITDADPDLTSLGSVPGHRNTGGRGFSLFNEALVCTNAVDTIRPKALPVYRGWDTPVHEFGHAVEHTLQLESRSDKIFSTNSPNYNPKVAREYFAWATSKWFASEGLDDPGRTAMPKWEHDYYVTIFSEDNKWVPCQDPRP